MVSPPLLPWMWPFCPVNAASAELLCHSEASYRSCFPDAVAPEPSFLGLLLCYRQRRWGGHAQALGSVLPLWTGLNVRSESSPVRFLRGRVFCEWKAVRSRAHLEDGTAIRTPHGRPEGLCRVRVFSADSRFISQTLALLEFSFHLQFSIFKYLCEHLSPYCHEDARASIHPQQKEHLSERREP